MQKADPFGPALFYEMAGATGLPDQSGRPPAINFSINFLLFLFFISYSRFMASDLVVKYISFSKLKSRSIWTGSLL
jgi:hypothetical protein